jgi:peptide/nickel transport system substrate-binding protein
LFLGSAPFGLAATGSTLWVATQSTTASSHRGGTLTVAHIGGALATLDPDIAYIAPISIILSSVYDTLVTWNRAPGVSGTQLVPDLAASLPAPADGGRTYTFILRPGIRYSNGTFVRASDFRRGIERALVLSHEGPINNDAIDLYFSTILGAGACPHHPKRCNLRAGIVTNDASGVVTFHLTHPDPDFLAKLAVLDFGAPIPPGTPFGISRLTRPIPGTGPYVITNVKTVPLSAPFYEGLRSMTLVRNRYFPVRNPWSIVARWIEEPSGRAAVSAVLRGTADLAFTTQQDVTRLTAAERAEQLRVAPDPATSFLVLNSRAPPFDNPMARQAAAYALSGDPVIARLNRARPACVLTPRYFPGSPGRCAYRRNLTRAGSLVRRSGTAGFSVAVYWDPSSRPVGQRVVDVLQRIGYHASLHLESDYYSNMAIYSKSRPVNVEFMGWGADYYEPSEFYEPFFACSGNYFTGLATCNPAIDRMAKIALERQVSDPAGADLLWRRVYERVGSDARIIPTSDGGNNLFLTSRRVGDYWADPLQVNYPLLDELWVK